MISQWAGAGTHSHRVLCVLVVRPGSLASGCFTMGLDVCLGNPGAMALALALASFPRGQAAGPAHLKVISLGSHFVLTFPSTDPRPCVTRQALYHFAFPSTAHPFGFHHPCLRPTNPSKSKPNKHALSLTSIYKS